jgi:Protein of unknown function (DUF2934)
MWLIHQFGSFVNLGICKEYPFMARVKTPGNGSTSRKQIATMPSPKPVEAKKNKSTVNLEEQIRIRAYQLYEERGYTPGHENEDWLVAEREILHSTDDQRSA